MSMEYTRVSKYAKLEAEHKELRKQYDALYNIAMAIRRSITAPPHPAPAIPQPRIPPDDEDIPKINVPSTETAEGNIKEEEDSPTPHDHYCGMNVMNSPSSYRALSPPISMVPVQNFPSQQMAILKDIPVRPLSRYVDHWLELCSGGMIAGISAALNNGI